MEAWLRQHITDGTIEDVAHAITERFGIVRTAKSVRVRANLLGLSTIPTAYTAAQVAYLFGVGQKRVQSWLEHGVLAGKRQRAGVIRSSWLISEAAVERLIRCHPEVYDHRKMRRGKWRALAEIVWLRDPHYSVTEAAKILGVTANTIYAHIARGHITATVVLDREKGCGKRWRIHRAQLSLLRSIMRSSPSTAKTGITVHAAEPACSPASTTDESTCSA